MQQMPEGPIQLIFDKKKKLVEVCIPSGVRELRSKSINVSQTIWTRSRLLKTLNLNYLILYY